MTFRIWVEQILVSDPMHKCQLKQAKIMSTMKAIRHQEIDGFSIRKRVLSDEKACEMHWEWTSRHMILRCLIYKVLWFIVGFTGWKYWWSF